MEAIQEIERTITVAMWFDLMHWPCGYGRRTEYGWPDEAWQIKSVLVYLFDPVRQRSIFDCSIGNISMHPLCMRA